jgi:hypothetical protein
VGVGLGIMGVALKPVMGVTDGLTSVVRYAQLICLLITFFLLFEWPPTSTVSHSVHE